MEAYKLHVKIGEDIFNAEGKESTVKEQFDQFKELVRNRVSITPAKELESVRLPIPPSGLFRIDEKRRLVTLKEKPTGENKNNQAVLLTLLGFKVKLNLEEVPSRLLKDSLRQSGFSVGRVDRFASALVRQSLINYSGTAKGVKYWLTNPGEKAALESLKGTQ